MPETSVLQQLAPTGKLRVAIAVAPSPSAQFAIKDGAGFKGVAVTLGQALAKKLGVEAQIVPHQASGEIQNSAADNKWDVAFLPVDEERKKFVDFGNAYHLLQSTFLVAPGSKLQSVKDADAKGIGIGGVANTATFRAAVKSTPQATHIEFKGVDMATAAMNEGKIEAIALSRELLGGLVGENPRLARAARCIPEFHHRRLHPQGQAGGAVLCQRIHRGGESLGVGAPRARRDGAEVLDRRAGGDEALNRKPKGHAMSNDQCDRAENEFFDDGVSDDALERAAGTGRELAANPTVPSAIICIPFEA